MTAKKLSHKERLIKNLLLGQIYLNNHLEYSLGLLKDFDYKRKHDRLIGMQEEFTRSEVEKSILLLLELGVNDVMTIREFCSILNTEEEKINLVLKKLESQNKIVLKKIGG